MPYDPTIWQTGDVITAEKLNKIEQALVDLYEQIEGGDEPIPEGYVVVAPEQSVTIVNDYAPAILTTVEGYVVPAETPSDWIVKANGITLEYVEDDPSSYNAEADGVLYIVYCDDEQVICFEPSDDGGPLIPGTYTVVIYAPDSK